MISILKHRPLILSFLFLYIFLTITYFYYGSWRNWPYKIEGDGKYYYHWLVAMATGHWLNIEESLKTPQYSWMKLPVDHYGMINERNKDSGHILNVFSIGPSFFWAPFYGLGKFLGYVLNKIKTTPIDLGPWGAYMQYFVMYSQVIYLVVAFYCLLSIFGEGISLYSKIMSKYLILFCTPLLYYCAVESSMSHLLDFASYSFVLYFTYLYAVNEKSTKLAAILGVFSGLHVLVRTQNLASIGLLCLFLLLISFREKTFLKLAISFLLSFIVISLPLPCVNYYMTKKIFVVLQGDYFLRNDSHWWDVLFSGRNGFFNHHPLLLVGFCGLVLRIFLDKKATQTARLFFLLLFGVFVTQVYINSIAADWQAGASFGQRRLVSSLPLFYFGFVFLIEWIKNHLNPIGKTIFSFLILALCFSGFYLMMIHIFNWLYDAPHNIWLWMYDRFGDVYGYLWVFVSFVSIALVTSFLCLDLFDWYIQFMRRWSFLKKRHFDRHLTTPDSCK